MDAKTEKELRSEWQYRVQRMDSLHDEAWASQTVHSRRQTEIWLEVQRHRTRIGEIAAMGVAFDEPVENPDGDKCPKCGSRDSWLARNLLSVCRSCGCRWL